MNGKELQALRKFCMLDVREAAEVIGKVSPRSWQYWEAGRSSVPEDVEDLMNGIMTMRQELLARLESEAWEHSDDPQDEHGDRLPVPFYATHEEYAKAHPEQGGVIAWRCHQSVVSELYANHLVTLT